MKNADVLDSLRAQGYAVGTPDAHTGRVRVWTRGSDEAVDVEIGSRRSMGAGYRAARPQAVAILVVRLAYRNWRSIDVPDSPQATKGGKGR
jgi:hypothetical protein